MMFKLVKCLRPAGGSAQISKGPAGGSAQISKNSQKTSFLCK